MTARDEVSDESLGFEVGAVDYIAKSVNPYLVKARVKAHLELQLAREELERQNEILRENVRFREEVEAISRHDLKNPLGAIPKSIRGRFFEKYATANKQGGTGLGAYSAKLSARTLGGTIAFETSEEKGTTITVKLPRV